MATPRTLSPEHQAPGRFLPMADPRSSEARPATSMDRSGPARTSSLPLPDLGDCHPAGRLHRWIRQGAGPLRGRALDMNPRTRHVPARLHAPRSTPRRGCLPPVGNSRSGLQHFRCGRHLPSGTRARRHAAPSPPTTATPPSPPAGTHGSTAAPPEHSGPRAPEPHAFQLLVRHVVCRGTFTRARGPGLPAALQAGVVADAHPGQGSHLPAAQARHALTGDSRPRAWSSWCKGSGSAHAPNRNPRELRLPPRPRPLGRDRTCRA